MANDPQPTPHPPTGPNSPPPKSQGGLMTLLIVVGIFAAMCVCCLPALLLPAVYSAREAARRLQCSNNLKQISLSLHNYHTVHGTFPPAYVADADGQPLYSWRVLILPYLEQLNVYEQFDLEQAWDSPANSHLSELNLPAYSCPSVPRGHDGLTHYALITGPEALFDGTKAPSLDIRDGTSNTILVIEMRDADIHWSEPRDVTMDDLLTNGINAKGHAGAGSYHPGGMHAALCDGSVHFLSETISPDTLRKLINPSDGEAVDFSGL